MIYEDTLRRCWGCKHSYNTTVGELVCAFPDMAERGWEKSYLPTYSRFTTFQRSTDDPSTCGPEGKWWCEAQESP